MTGSHEVRLHGLESSVSDRTHKGLQLQSLPLNEDTLANADLVVLTTNHAAFDVDFIQQHARLIFDLRNMIKEGGDNIYKL